MNVALLKLVLFNAVAFAVLTFCPHTSNAESSKKLQASESASPQALPKIDPKLSPAEGIIELVEQSPQLLKTLDSGVVFVDFGRVAFGNIEFTPPSGFRGTLQVRFGEKLLEGAIDRKPPGTVRYSQVQLQITSDDKLIVAPPAEERNTQQSAKGRRSGPTPPAVLTPAEWGVITPFRWIEIEGLPAGLETENLIRRAAFPKHWDESSAHFSSSDETLNRVWELCKYSIKATMYAGVYVDGDRERIPYEADAYLNQLSHYYTDHDTSMARSTFDWLLAYPTWPSEWGPHMVFMAHADWMRNGDKQWLSQRYNSLKPKTLIERCDNSNLVQSNKKQTEWNDIVDWPPSERDGYKRSEVNTVINAFHIAAVEKMAEMAEAVGNQADAKHYQEHAKRAREAFYNHLFNAELGLFQDGREVAHKSVHANFFPLAFGIVKEADRQKIADWLVERGMRCSTYASQYMLEALFENGAGESAVNLIIAPGKRSWRHMLESDATITWESWNEIVKPNLDWNHAWGAAPGNLLPRFVLGAQPLVPGWSRAKIQPYLSGLEFANGVVPTPHGPISIDWNQKDNFQLKLELPKGITASVQVPSTSDAEEVLVDGQKVEADLVDGYWILKQDLAGKSTVEVRQ